MNVAHRDQSVPLQSPGWRPGLPGGTHSKPALQEAAGRKPAGCPASQRHCSPRAGARGFLVERSRDSVLQPPFTPHSPFLLLRPALLCLLFGLAAPLPLARADDLPPAGRTAGLEDRLKAGLRAQLPAEEDFIEKVVLLVRTGKLPGKLVDSTYIWAIERRKEYPFPAFEKALRLQADKLGVRL